MSYNENKFFTSNKNNQYIKAAAKEFILKSVCFPWVTFYFEMFNENENNFSITH